ncbi:MerR family DNA-binding transcriptional regulator [Caldichromatium japonicum]
MPRKCLMRGQKRSIRWRLLLGIPVERTQDAAVGPGRDHGLTAYAISQTRAVSHTRDCRYAISTAAPQAIVNKSLGSQPYYKLYVIVIIFHMESAMMSTGRAAKRLGVSVKTLQRWEREGGLILVARIV